MIHTARVKWCDGSDEFFFISLDGERFLEVPVLPDPDDIRAHRNELTEQVQGLLEGRGRPVRPMTWARRAIDAMYHDGHGVTISGH